MSGSIPETEIGDCESGPYCKHWDDPASCLECAIERLRDAGYTVTPPEPKKKGRKP